MQKYIERGELESILEKRYYELSDMPPDFYAGYAMPLPYPPKEEEK